MTKINNMTDFIDIIRRLHVFFSERISNNYWILTDSSYPDEFKKSLIAEDFNSETEKYIGMINNLLEYSKCIKENTDDIDKKEKALKIIADHIEDNTLCLVMRKSEMQNPYEVMKSFAKDIEAIGPGIRVDKNLLDNPLYICITAFDGKDAVVYKNGTEPILNKDVIIFQVGKNSNHISIFFNKKIKPANKKVFYQVVNLFNNLNLVNPGLKYNTSTYDFEISEEKDEFDKLSEDAAAFWKELVENTISLDITAKRPAEDNEKSNRKTRIKILETELEEEIAKNKEAIKAKEENAPKVEEEISKEDYEKIQLCGGDNKKYRPYLCDTCDKYQKHCYPSLISENEKKEGKIIGVCARKIFTEKCNVCVFFNSTCFPRYPKAAAKSK